MVRLLRWGALAFAYLVGAIAALWAIGALFFDLPWASLRGVASIISLSVAHVQAGAVRLTTIPALLEWQRDWAKREHYDNLMGLIKGQGGAYGVGVEYAYTMVHHAPQSAAKPQVVPEKAAH